MADFVHVNLTCGLLVSYGKNRCVSESLKNVLPIECRTVLICLLPFTPAHSVVTFPAKWWKKLLRSSMFQFFCSILCPRSPEKTESCGEVKNKIHLLVPQIAEGFWSCTSDAALLQDPLRFEVHQEIVHGHSFSLQWKTSEFSSAVSHLDSVVTVLLFMLESPRCNHQSKRTFFIARCRTFPQGFSVPS